MTTPNRGRNPGRAYKQALSKTKVNNGIGNTSCTDGILALRNTSSFSAEFMLCISSHTAVILTFPWLYGSLDVCLV